MQQERTDFLSSVALSSCENLNLSGGGWSAPSFSSTATGKKSKQGREQQRVLVHVRSNLLLQKVEGDKGVLENLLSFCVTKSGRRGQKKSCSAAAAKIQKEIKDKTKLSDFS